MSTIVQQSYFYKAGINFSPNLVNLSQLYKPIIGDYAYLMYIEMLNESKTNPLSIQNKRSLYDLFKRLNVDSKKFHENRKILESVNLITTYFENDKEKEMKYYFLLNHPLDFNSFFLNKKFKKLLSLKISQQSFNELEFIFETIKIPSFAKNISSDFNEVFKNEISIEYDFNFDELYSRITQISSTHVAFSKNSKDIINSFFKSFSLTIDDIEKCVLDSIIEDGKSFVVDENTLNSELSILTNKINKINFYDVIKLHRCNQIFSKEINQEDLNKIFLDYKNIKSEQYLVSLQKQQLNDNEINAIRSLRRDLYLIDPIINVILDFSLKKTYGNINMKYIKKAAKTISILNLEKLEDVYNHFTESTYPKNQIKNKFNINSTNPEDDLNIVDIII